MAEKINIDDLLKDEDYKKLVHKNLQEVLNQRRNRKDPPKGMRYKKDWYDRMGFGQLNTESFLFHIKDIWMKKSNLSAQERSVIQFVCDKALGQFIELCNEEE